MDNQPNNEILIYQAQDGSPVTEVRLDAETLWLSLNQMAELFGRDKSVISRHLRNVFKEGELEREATVAKNATVQHEGEREVIREIEFFNIYASGELDRSATVSKMETVRQEGKRTMTRMIEHYNLDAAISVGYRVNSTRTTRFRQWTSRVLKDYLTQGYAVNEKRLHVRKPPYLSSWERPDWMHVVFTGRNAMQS